jgi:hypothetical protein
MIKIEQQPLTPGSSGAFIRGCLCPRVDNHHGRGMPYPEGPRFVIRADCPMHGRDALAKELER